MIEYLKNLYWNWKVNHSRKQKHKFVEQWINKQFKLAKIKMTYRNCFDDDEWFTNNTITKEKEQERLMPKKPENLDDELFKEFIAYRKNIVKAPLTQRALDGLIRESQKAGKELSDVLILVMEKGWRGFEASYGAQKVTYPDDMMSIDDLMKSMGGTNGSE
jgi:hypothetical protein